MSLVSKSLAVYSYGRRIRERFSAMSQDRSLNPEPLDWTGFDWISFDCYGTLIDWESGLLAAMRPQIEAQELRVDDRALLELYAKIEPSEQSGDFRPYAEVLRGCARRLSSELGLDSLDENVLVDSLASWPAFDDSHDALVWLAQRYRLAVLSNIDDELFEHSQRRLGVEFDAVVTAQSVGAYKPELAVFEAAEARIGVARSRWLHVAQSRFHDIAPARQLGIQSVHVNRRSRVVGFGATPTSDAVPNLSVPDLATLVERIARST